MRPSTQKKHQLYGISFALIVVLFLADFLIGISSPKSALASSLKLQNQYPIQTTTIVTHSPYPSPGTRTSTAITIVTSTLIPGTTATLSGTDEPTYAILTPGIPSTITPGAGSTGPTATLIPLPSITIMFPETATPEPIALDKGSYSRATPVKDRFWPLALVGLAWVLLVILYFFLRRNIH